MLLYIINVCGYFWANFFHILFMTRKFKRTVLVTLCYGDVVTHYYIYVL